MITLDSIDYANHSIQIKDAAGDALAIAADGSIAVTDNGGSLTVDGTVAVSAIPGTFAEDSAHASGDVGMQMLAVRNDTASSLVSANGDYAPLQVTSLGALRTTVPFNGTNGAAIPTNSGLVGGSDGTNLIPLKVDAAGELQIDVLTQPARSHATDSMKIGDGTDFLAVNADGSINVQSAEAGYGNWKVSTATVGLSEVQLVSTPLTGRLRVEIQNLGTKDIWIKEVTGVSTANGLKIPKGSSYEQALDAGSSIFAISDGASADLRIAEYAA